MKYGLTLTIVIFLNSMAQASVLPLDAVGEATLIGRYVEYCDCSPDTSIKDFLSGKLDHSFVKHNTDRLLLPRNKQDIYWVRLVVNNPLPEHRLRTLLIAFNIGLFWELYHIQGADYQKMVTGFQHGGSGFYPHFSLNLHPGRNVIYLKMPTNRVSLWFGTEEKVANVTQQQLFFATSMLAFATLITLGSLTVAVMLRNLLFVFYALYTSSTVIFVLLSSNILVITGFDITQFAGLEYVDIVNLSMAYDMVATLLFINHFLQLPRWSPVIYRILAAFGVSGIAFLLLLIILEVSNFKLQSFLILLYCILITSVFVYAVYRGIDNAKKGLFSWSVYVVGIAISSVLILGIHPLIGLNLSWASMVLEMLLFGFISMREIYRKQLQMSEEKEHSFRQLQKLVYPEQLEMMRGGRFLEDTMPIEQAEAVVLCFDIIQSTKIDPHKHHVFFEDFFVNCQHLMNEGLTIGHEKVRLFRVKEMGDGFICSIGFPLSCDVNQAEVAVYFVDQVVQLFWQSARRHLQHIPYGLGIGIAGGSVGGYFPRSGIMQYDLYGMAIVLATRYENMRRQLQDKLTVGTSIVIVQDMVFQKLPETLKKRFQCYHLDQTTFKVRDDPDAKQFWYDLLKMPTESRLAADSMHQASKRKFG
ncbi:MAG: 7TM diverse intracellular signaling domain-containing protein [Oligoflexus sp.]